MPRLPRRVMASPRTSSAHDNSTEEAPRRLQSHTQSTASPVRKMNSRSRQQRRPRESLLEEDSILSESDDSQSVASPYTPRAQEQPPTSKIANGKQKAQKDRLQKAAVHNAARRSLGLQHAQNHTPRQIPLRDDDVSSDMPVVGTALTPASKRPMPILSNFEDWLKLATENKINVNNSWNFALIDYFHEMSLLKDDSGRGINFQKASCTLDGCVKIYVGRVESVGVEAGRLLSGLANSNSDDEPKKKKRRGDDDEEGEEGEEGSGDEDEEGGKKKEKKRKARSHEATLAPSFASLQLKKLELEFAVDPLFKKASADFDEGGAKGLLLNHLCIDEVGRIVFDSSDDAVDTEKSTTKETESEESENTQNEQSQSQSQQPSSQDSQFEDDAEIDIASLGAKFFSNLSNLSSLDICPSMKDFRIGDPNATIPLLSGNSDWKDSSKSKSPEKSQPPPLIPLDGNLADQSGLFLDDNNAGIDFDDDDDAGGFAFGMGDDVGFGQGGEAWAKEAAAHPGLRPVAASDDDNQDLDGDGYAVSMQHRYQEDIESETMLAFFGKAINSRAQVGTKAFENLTNWRIARIQKQQAAENAPPTRQRKEKEPFEIDFHSPMSDSLKKLLAEPRVANDKISIPKSQLKTKGKNLLDLNDVPVDVKSLMRLWTKPKCRIVRRRNGPAVVDEGFGGKGREAPRLNDEKNDIDDDDDVPATGDYDADFFADDEPLPFFDGPLPIDDDFDDDNGGEQPGFVDAREMLSPQPDGGDQLQQNLNEILNDNDGDQPPYSQDPDQGLEIGTQTDPAQGLLPGSFGSQLVTQAGRRLRPEYVNFARVAKKVDVRALKENMWKGMSNHLDFSTIPSSSLSTPPLTDAETETDTDGDGDTEMTDADIDNQPPISSAPLPSNNTDNSSDPLKFTQILTDLKSVYPEPQMKDISTSYGFICLLHLANEKGLVLEGGREEGGMEEILVRRDLGVGEGYVGE